MRVCPAHPANLNDPQRLTNGWSQLQNASRAGSLDTVKSTSDFMKEFSMFATLAPASGS